jgi:ubiquinone/menaquinone biosynthesis C-methylase UbiE
MDKVSGAVDAFELSAEDYDSWFESPEGKALFKAEADAVRILMKGLMPPFLEVGVGSGRFALALGIGHGIDPSQTLLEKARARGIEVKHGKGEDLPYEDNRFGGVFILFTLCFVEEPERVIAEAKRVLKPGGGLVVGIINRQSPWGLLYLKKKTDGHPIYRHANFYSAQEAVDMMKRVDLSIGAFSSTLLRPPSENHKEEIVLDRLREGAGFICILAKKDI